MTTSGDIAPIETKLMLQQNAIPKFSSYLSKLLKDKKKVKNTTKITKTKLKVFEPKKSISEEMFSNLQKIIRDNNVGIRNVKIIQDTKLNESRKAIDYKKEIFLYSEEDCKFVFEGFKEYTGISMNLEKNSVTFEFNNPKYDKLNVLIKS